MRNIVVYLFFFQLASLFGEPGVVPSGMIPVYMTPGFLQSSYSTQVLRTYMMNHGAVPGILNGRPVLYVPESLSFYRVQKLGLPLELQAPHFPGQYPANTKLSFWSPKGSHLCSGGAHYASSRILSEGGLPKAYSCPIGELPSRVGGEFLYMNREGILGENAVITVNQHLTGPLPQKDFVSLEMLSQNAERMAQRNAEFTSELARLHALDEGVCNNAATRPSWKGNTSAATNGAKTCIRTPNIAGSALKNLGVKSLPVIGIGIQAYMASGPQEQLQMIKVIENRKDLSFGDRLDCAAAAIYCTMNSQAQFAVDRRYRAAMRKYQEITEANAAYIQKRLPRHPISIPTDSEEECNEAMELAIARKRLQQALRE